MKKSLGLIFFLIANLIHAQSELEFDFDYAKFKYGNKIYLEIYYSINQSSLRVNKNDTSKTSSALLSLKLFSTDSSKYVINKKYQVNAINKPDEGLSRNLLGVLGYIINSGNYKLEIKVSNFTDSTISKRFEEKLIVRKYDESNINLSDVQFSSRIINDSNNSKSIFYKNTLEVYPHPVNVFGKTYPIIFYYLELYNLLADTTRGNLFLISQVIDSKGKKVFEKSKSILRKNNEVVEAGAINISKYLSGAYTFYINLFNQSTNKGIVSSKKFYVYNPDVVDTSAQKNQNITASTSEYAVLSEEECDEMFLAAQNIAAGNEIEKYKKLTSVEAKREFFFQFWKARDSDPSTVENEFKNLFIERVKHVESKYKSFNKRGVKTDRGRIYVTYGEPDEIEMHPNDYDKKPYEIWFYNSIEGGVIFIFGDVAGYGDYELLHSTKRGEMRDDNWARRILTN